MLLGIVPFGIITGVVMVASGIPPLVAMLMSILVGRALRYVPAAVLTAIWAPEVLVQNEQLPAGVVAFAVAWRWGGTFATIAAGLLALHFFAWLT